MRYPITPVAKPRQTQRDKWQKRPGVLRYRAFADACRVADIRLPAHNASIIFYLPMPSSWPKKKRLAMAGAPHQQKPDLSNLLKALEDAVLADDSVIWSYRRLSKVWSVDGGISIL